MPCNIFSDLVGFIEFMDGQTELYKLGHYTFYSIALKGVRVGSGKKFRLYHRNHKV